MEIQRMQIAALPGGNEKLGSALASLTGPREVLAGCLNCRVLQGWHDSSEFRVEIDWESKEDLIRYLQSPTYKQLLLLLELSPKAPVIRFFSVTELRGLDLVEAARACSREPNAEGDFYSQDWQPARARGSGETSDS